MLPVDTFARFSLVETAAPAEEPVSLAEAKAHAAIEITDDDTMVTAFIVAARQWAETFMKRQIITATYTLLLDEFPDVITLPRPPLSVVNSVKYLDTDGVQQTLDAALYTVDTYSTPGRIMPAYNEVWPDYRSQFNCIEVAYDCGYGDATAVPEWIKLAIKILVAHWYEHRRPVTEGAINEVPWTCEALLFQGKQWLV